MGIDDGQTDFCEVFREMGIRDEWILLPGNSASEIRAAFRAAFKTRDRDDWVAELGPGNACVAAVNTMSEVVADPQFQARGVFVEADHPHKGVFQQLGPVLAGGDRETQRGCGLVGVGRPDDPQAGDRSKRRQVLDRGAGRGR